MKKLLTLLLRRESTLIEDKHQWWTLEETKHGEPPEERTGMYTWPQILQALKAKLSNWGEE